MEFGLFYFSSEHRAEARDRYELCLQGARYADENDFTAVWIPERHFHPFGGLYPSPSVLCSYLSGQTRRVRLRAGSVVLPLNESIRVAEEWAMVDNLSQGRVDLAFATGWHARDFVLRPDVYDGRVDVMFSQIECVRRLWRGGTIERVDGSGKSQDIQIFPKPLQKELAIWITCVGGSDRFVQAGRAGANVLTALLVQTSEQLARNIADYRQARKDAGHDPDAGRVTLMLHTFIGPDLAKVKKIVRGPFTDYLKSSVDLWRSQIKSLQLDRQSSEFLYDYAFERYFNIASLLGTPKLCLARVKAFEKMGVDGIAALIDFGVDVATTLKHLKYLNQLRKMCLS